MSAVDIIESCLEKVSNRGIRVVRGATFCRTAKALSKKWTIDGR